MAVEDFTTYTKVDENSDITVVATTITVDTMRRDATSYVKRAYPAATFGNFVHKFDINFTAASADTANGPCWMVSNSSNTFNEGLTNNEGLVAFVYRNNSTDYEFYIYDCSDDGSANSSWASAPGVRYITIQRNGTTLTCLIHTDSGRTTLESALQLTVPNTAYANIIPVCSRDSAPADTPTISYTVSNLDLQFATATVSVTGGGGEGGIIAVPQKSSVSPPQQAARKPYLSLKQSMREFFSAHVRYLKESNQKESVFEKPYRDIEYTTMHLNIPTPDWGGSSSRWWYRPGEWTPGPDPKGGGVPVLNCPGCALYADPLFGSCEDNPVEIHSGIWCTNTPGAGAKLDTKKVVGYVGNTSQEEQSGSQVSYRTEGVIAGDTKLEIYVDGVGVIKDIAVGAWAFIGPSAAVYVDPATPFHRICGRMVDGAGSVCHACVDVTCACDCTTTTLMTIDAANTDTTITAGSTATVTVLDGCGPFTWGISGKGVVLDSLSTTGRSNRITSITGACASVVSALVTVTVTDDCGTIVTADLKNSVGTWVQESAYSPEGCNTGGVCVCPTPSAEIINYKLSSTGKPVRWRTIYSGSCTTGCNSVQIDSQDHTSAWASCGSTTLLRTEPPVPAHPTACWGPPSGGGGGGSNVSFWGCAGGSTCVY